MLRIILIILASFAITKIFNIDFLTVYTVLSSLAIIELSSREKLNSKINIEEEEIRVKFVDFYTDESIAHEHEKTIEIPKGQYDKAIKSIKNYKFKEYEIEQSKDNIKTIKYKYIKQYTLTVEHINTDTKELLTFFDSKNEGYRIARDTIKYSEREHYITTSKNIDGYKFYRAIGKTDGTIYNDTSIVFEYKKV